MQSSHLSPIKTIPTILTHWGSQSEQAQMQPIDFFMQYLK